jgi:hypothetical protein
MTDVAQPLLQVLPASLKETLKRDLLFVSHDGPQPIIDLDDPFLTLGLHQPLTLGTAHHGALGISRGQRFVAREGAPIGLCSPDEVGARWWRRPPGQEASKAGLNTCCANSG